MDDQYGGHCLFCRKLGQIEPQEKNDVSHMLTIRDRLQSYHELVSSNLKDAQQEQKRWYDKTARERRFAVGDNVLVLVPGRRNKLVAQWEGPYPITKVVGPVDYAVNRFDKRKNHRDFLVNMLRKWVTPVATSYMAESVEDNIQMFDMDVEDSPTVGQSLTEEQQKDIQKLVNGSQDVFSNQPGKTTLAEHSINTGDATPTRQAGSHIRIEKEYRMN